VRQKISHDALPSRLKASIHPPFVIKLIASQSKNRVRGFTQMSAISGYRSVLFGLTAGIYSVSSAAADAPAPASEPATLEEILVTAQKKQERLIDVPAVINEVKASDLAEQNVQQIFDYYSRIPGLSYNGNKTYDLSLRGITTGGATNPTLAILVDDIQFGSSTTAGLGNSLFPDFDPSMLDRVEVLHGPQGTLYGAASLGGLIKYVTRQPDPDKFFGRVEAGFESVQGGGLGWTTRGAVNIPLVSERVALNVSAFTRWDPAYIDNVNPALTANDVNRTHVYGGNAALLLKPFDGLSITLSALQQKRHADFSNSVQADFDANGRPDFSKPTYGENKINLGATSDVGNQQLYSARIVWDVAGLQITSLSSFQKSEGTNFQDVSSVFANPQGLNLPTFYGLDSGFVFIDDAASTRKLTQELRVSGKVDSFDWRGGLYYTREYGSVDQTLNLFDGNNTHAATPYIGASPTNYKEKAAFADGVYHLTRQWDLQAGVRYAKNDQLIGGNTTTDEIGGLVFGPSNVAANLISSDHSTTWAVSPIFHITPDMMVYARAASGYRPGGPNTVLPNVPATFAPDKVVDYEVGFKGILADRTFSWDAALFQINWQHVQLQDTDNATEFTYFTNGGSARSRGLELAVSWKPYSGLTVDATTTFMDAVLTQDLPTLANADSLEGKSGDRLPASARFSSNLNVQQDFPITDSLTGYVGVNWSFVGTRQSEFSSTAALASDSPEPRFDLPSYSVVDLRTGLNYATDWHLNVFLRNIANKEGVVFADNRNGTAVTSVRYLQPRTVGMFVSRDF